MPDYKRMYLTIREKACIVNRLISEVTEIGDIME